MKLHITMVVSDDQAVWAGAGHWPQGEALEQWLDWKEVYDPNGATEHWLTVELPAEPGGIVRAIDVRLSGARGEAEARARSACGLCGRD